MFKKVSNEVKKMEKEERIDADFVKDNFTKLPDDLKKPIVTPITFTSKGNAINETLCCLPINQFAFTNNTIALNTDWATKFLSIKDLALLDHSNCAILIDLLLNYIRQESLMNICSSIQIGEANLKGYLSLLPIKEYISDAIYSELTGGIVKILADYLMKSESAPTSYPIDREVKDSDKHQIATINYTCIVSSQIAIIIYNAICAGAQRAITESIMGVYHVPNIDNLIKKLSQDYSVIANSGVDVRSTCALLLNKLLADDIEKCMKLAIYPGITNLLVSALSSSYFLFDDLAKAKIEEARSIKSES